MHLSRKIFLNTLIQFGGKLLSTVLALVTIGLLSRYLGTVGLGAYATVVRYLGFFGIIADFGFNLVVTREIATRPQQEEHIMANALSLRLLTATPTLLLAPLSAYFFYDTVKITGLWIAVLTFFFILVTQLYNGVFQKHLRTDKMAIAELVNRLVILGGTVLAIRAGASMLTMLWVMNLGNAFGLIFTVYYLRRYMTWRCAWQAPEIRRLLKLAAPLALINFFNLIYFNADSLILSWVQGDYAMGIYHVAYKVLETLFTLIVILVGIFIPLLAHQYEHQTHLFWSNWQRLLGNITVAAGLTVVLGIYFAAEIINILAGPDFGPSILTLQILFPAIGLLFLTTLLKNSFVVMEKQHQVWWIFALGAFLNVLGNWFLIPRYSYLGAAATTFGSELLALIMCLGAWRGQYRWPIDWRTLGKISGAFLLLGILLYLLPPLALWIKVPVALLSAAVTLFLFRLPYLIHYAEN